MAEGLEKSEIGKSTMYPLKWKREDNSDLEKGRESFLDDVLSKKRNYICIVLQRNIHSSYLIGQIERGKETFKQNNQFNQEYLESLARTFMM